MRGNRRSVSNETDDCLPIQRVVIGCLCAVALAALACADGPEALTTPSATTPSITATAPQADAPSLSASSTRSGAFHVTKECSTYTGQAEDHCTVIGSDLKAIEVGTRFVYEQAVVNGVLDSSVILDPPGPGNNKPGLATHSGQGPIADRRLMGLAVMSVP
jgi:hypothetical protein